MDEFDFKESKPKASRRRTRSGGGGGCSDLIWNLGTLYFLVSSLCLAGFVAAIFMNPQAPYNPLPPRPQTSRPIPTLIPIPSAVPASPTSAVVEEPSPTAIVFEPTATATIGPTVTPFSFPEVTPSNTPTGQGVFFSPNQGDPTYLAHPDGCTGLYIAGSVFDSNGAPAIFWLVRMSGAFGTVDAYSGSASAYGESGYEIKIANAPQNSQIFMQILDDLTGQPVSELIVVNTFSDCARNLALLNWTQAP